MRGLVAGIAVVGVVGLAIWAAGSGAWAQAIHSPASTPSSGPTSGPAVKYQDGTYTGQAQGHRGPIEVEVKVAGGKIETVKVTKQQDDAAYFNRAVALVPKIVEKQGVQGVNTVTGATFSSKGILGAAKAALANATSQPAGH